jgi:hypothetical protein
MGQIVPYRPAIAFWASTATSPAVIREDVAFKLFANRIPLRQIQDRSTDAGNK